MVLLGWPATSPSSTCRSRFERVANLTRICARSASRLASAPWCCKAAFTALSRISSSNGFSKNSSAPDFIAWTANGTSACPVITITGRRTRISFSRFSRSMPERSGMRTSVMTQPVVTSLIRCRKDVALSYVSTDNPALLRRKLSDSRTAWSSSMTCTTESFCIVHVLLADRPKRELEHRAGARIGFGPDSPSVAFDDRAGDREAHAHAVPLGGDEGLKQVQHDFLGDPRPAIGDADQNHSIVGRRDGYHELAPLRWLHCLDRVAHQVEHDLLDLHLVGQDQVRVRVELERDPHAEILRSHQCQRARLLDQFLDAFDLPLALAARHEVAQPSDDLAGAQGLLCSPIHGVAHRGDLLVGMSLEQPPRALQIVRDCRQGLIELMRERGCHLAHRGKARDVHQLGLKLMNPLFGLLPLAQIADEPGEEAPVV